ncbi:MAG: hypothetical protein N2C14_19740, partial [Planctomycetales bacterium]
MSDDPSQATSSTPPAPKADAKSADSELNQSTPSADADSSSAQEATPATASGSGEPSSSSPGPDVPAAISEPEKPKRAIKIGSQQEGAEPITSKAQTAPVPPPPVKDADKDDDAAAMEKGSPSAPRRPATPPPSKRDPLPNELEQEIAEALGDQSLDQIMEAGKAPAATVEFLEKGTKLRARIIKIHADNIFADIKQPSEGVFSAKQFDNKPPKIGDFVDALVDRYVESEGLYYLMVPHAAADAGDWSQIEEDMVLDVFIT